MVLLGVALTAYKSALPVSGANPRFVISTTKPADSVTPVLSENAWIDFYR